jgi:hypothetical protein
VCGEEGQRRTAKEVMVLTASWNKVIEDSCSVSKCPWKKSEGKNLGGREILKRKLIADLGLSRRQSVLVMNVMLEEMIAALKRGCEVEFPFGKLTRVKRHFGQWWDKFDDYPAHRQPWTVEFELSPAGQEQLFGPQEKAERAYLEAAWKPPAREKRERGGKKQRRVRSGK